MRGLQIKGLFLINKDFIAGVTVLYNPNEQAVLNILKYIHQISFLYIVDNSEHDNHHLFFGLEKYENFEYIWNKTNLGIAKALNIGAKRALCDGFSYLLTMDQDSQPSPTMIQDLINPEYDIDFNRLGILSPFLSIHVDQSPPDHKSYEEIQTVWTSGSLLSLSAYNTTGPFYDDLFIDFVDHEYCLRLAINGYKIYKVYTSILKHEIGTNIQKNRFLGFEFITSNHSALRKYYITRNRLYISKIYKKKFPDFFYDDKKKMIADFINIFLFEQNKFSKFKMIFKGYIHYKKNKLGKYQPLN